MSNDCDGGTTWISTFGHFGADAERGHSDGARVASLSEKEEVKEEEEDTSSLRFVFDTHTGE